MSKAREASPSGVEHQAGPFRGWRYAIFVIALLSALVYTPSFRGEFVYDDETSYREAANKFTKFSHAFDPPVRFDSYFRPLPLLTGISELRLASAVSSSVAERDLTYRAIGSVDNYLLHAFNTFLVYAVALTFLSGFAFAPWAALFAAAWFGLHPIHTEVAAWRSGQTDLITTLTWLGSTLLAAKYWRNGKPLWAAGSGLLFLGALLSKENAAMHILTLPLLLWLLHRTNPAERPADWKPRAAWLAGASALAAAAYLALRLTFFNLSAPYDPPQAAAGFFDVVRVLGLYLAKLLAPWPQSPYITELPSPGFTLAAFGVAAALFAGGWLWKRYPRPVLLVGGFWAVFAALPGLVYILRPAGTVIATERILYIPTVGVALLVGCLFGVLMERPSWRKPALAAAAAVLAAYGAGSVSYARTFSTARDFWTAASKNWGGGTDKYVLVGLGSVHMRAGEYREAAAAFRRSLAPESFGIWQPHIRRRFDQGASRGYLQAQGIIAENLLLQGDAAGASVEAQAALALLPTMPITDVAGRDPFFAYFIGLNYFVRAEAQSRAGVQAADDYARALESFENASRLGWRDQKLTQRIQYCRMRLTR